MNKLAQQILRWQYKLKTKFRRPLLNIRRRIKQVWVVLSWVFFGLMMMFGLLVLAFKIWGENEDGSAAWYLVSIASAVYHYLPFDGAMLWAAQFNEQWVASWAWDVIGYVFMLLLMVCAFLAVLVSALVVLWFLPERILERKEVETKARLETLQVALRPVPSRRDILVRLLTVTTVVWVGLNLAELWARRNGWCLLAISNGCDHTYINDLAWSGAGVLAGLFSISNMIETRKARRLAKQKLRRARDPRRKKLRRWTRIVVWTLVGSVTVWVIIVFLVEMYG